MNDSWFDNQFDPCRVGWELIYGFGTTGFASGQSPLRSTRGYSDSTPFGVGRELLYGFVTTGFTSGLSSLASPVAIQIRPHLGVSLEFDSRPRQ